MLRRLLLYYRTARYLRPRQWIYFPFRRLGRRGARPLTATPVPNEQRLANLREAAVVLRRHSDQQTMDNAEAAASHRFVFLNRTEILPKIDWNKRNVSQLWDYNLHYFDYAADLANTYLETRDTRFIAAFEELITSWIHGTAGGKGDGWDPYPTSVRIVNWIYARLLLEDSLTPSFKELLASSLFRQLSHLERHLEWHLMGNHLQRNLTALWLGGLVFQGERARQWREKAGRSLSKEITLQILPDGGHAERTPMYHAIAMRDLLEVLYISRAVGHELPADAADRIRKMAPALAALMRTSGEIHLFNDSAQGVAPPTSLLRRLGNTVVGVDLREADGAWSLPDTGFYGYRDARVGNALVVDGGSPGPPHQPGHAHCGLLSYELDLAGIPVVVDAGVHGYKGDRFREYVRSTRAHNTVTVNDKEQSEVWGTFRMGRRARVISAVGMSREGRYEFEGSYRPYHARNVVHSRKLLLTPEVLEVTDMVSGEADVAESFVHFHPDFSLRADADCVFATGHGLTLRVEASGVDLISVRKGEDSPIQGWYCPEFGKAFPQYLIAMRVNQNTGAPFGYRITVVPRPE